MRDRLKIRFKSRGEGVLTFANGRHIFGSWRFACSPGYAPGKLRNALIRDARDQKIPGRSKVVRFECTIEPIAKGSKYSR